jgi:predicted transcriptional regulator
LLAEVSRGFVRSPLSLIIGACLEKQQRFQLELKEYSHAPLTPSNIVSTLEEYHQTIEELQYKERQSEDKIRQLEEQLTKNTASEKAHRTKCIFLAKQIKKLSTKAK